MSSVKYLTVEFIYNGDGNVTTRIKPSDENYSPDELYMAYKNIEAVLNEINFDWAAKGDIDAKLTKKGEN